MAIKQPSPLPPLCGALTIASTFANKYAKQIKKEMCVWLFHFLKEIHKTEREGLGETTNKHAIGVYVNAHPHNTTLSTQ